MTSDDKGIVACVATALIGIALVLGVGMFFGNQSQQAFDEQATERITSCLEANHSPGECRVVALGRADD